MELFGLFGDGGETTGITRFFLHRPACGDAVRGQRDDNGVMGICLCGIPRELVRKPLRGMALSMARGLAEDSVRDVQKLGMTRGRDCAGPIHGQSDSNLKNL